MQRIFKSQTFAKVAAATKPAAEKINFWFSTQYAKLCRDQTKQRQVVVGLALLVAIIFFVSVTRLQAQRERLMATADALIATRHIGAGELVTPSAAAAFALPSTIFAPDAISDLPQPAIAQRDINPGDLITSSNVAVRPITASLVPEGWRTVAITPQSALPPMRAGDHVDVIANNVVLVANAIVVLTKTVSAAGEIMSATQVVIAIPADAAATVATAAAIGDATLVVAP